MEENESKETQVISEKAAYIMTNMLESAVLQGTGGNAYIGQPMAGKTGTTDDTKDAWFVGYTPEISAAVWMGDDYDSDLQGLTGGTVPASIWRDFMSTAAGIYPGGNFIAPAGVAGIAAEGFQNPKDDKDKDKDKKKKKDGEADHDDASDTDTSSPNADRTPGRVKGAPAGE